VRENAGRPQGYSEPPPTVLQAIVVPARSFAQARWSLLTALLGAVLLVCCGRDPCQKLARTRWPVEDEVESLSS
jgi:hypothetical protein